MPWSIMNVPLKQFPNQHNFNQAKHLSISSCSSPTEVRHECRAQKTDAISPIIQGGYFVPGILR